jgi:hypothetical protein
MAGNKKPNRRRGERRQTSVTVPNVARAFAVAEQREIERRNTLTSWRNALPLGHELNQHKIDEVMAPLEGFLHDVETTGEAAVDDDGKPVFWSDEDRDWVPIGQAILSMTMMLELVARNFTWGSIPTGLRDLAIKIEDGHLFDQHDTAAARSAIDWIRRRVAEATPNQWGAAYAEAVKIVDAREAQQRASAQAAAA